MLNEILAIIKLLIDRYGKSKKQETLNMLIPFCKNLCGSMIQYIPANEINKIPAKKITTLYNMQHELSAMHNNDKKETYNKCKDMYNLIMELTNEDW